MAKNVFLLSYENNFLNDTNKINCIMDIFPLSDAYNKARINNNINGFEILTILLINMINRIGVFYQRHFAK